MTITDELRDKATTDVRTAAKVYGIGLNQAYAGVREGTIPSVRIGGRIVVLVQPMLRMLRLDGE